MVLNISINTREYIIEFNDGEKERAIRIIGNGLTDALFVYNCISEQLMEKGVGYVL